MGFTFIKLRQKLEGKRYGNALNDCLLLLRHSGFSNYESQDYILEKYLDVKVTKIRLLGNSSVDVIIEHIKNETCK